MYFMRQLSFGEQLERQFKQSTILEMRAHIVEQFVMGKNSLDPNTLPDLA